MRRGGWLVGFSTVLVACSAVDPFVGTFVGTGQASTGDANGANPTAQSATMEADITSGPGGEGGVGPDGSALAPYLVRVAAPFDGSPIGAVDCTLTAVYGSGPSVAMLAGQACSATVGGVATQLTLFTGQATWSGTTLTATLIWTWAGGRTRWTVTAPRQ